MGTGRGAHVYVPRKDFDYAVNVGLRMLKLRRLVGELKKRGFSSVIIPPSADRFYRVQVGPLESAELADAAQQRLEAQGFRQILKIKR